MKSLWDSLAILLLAILACITYGILHDQVTARICVEYFTVGHPPIFDTEDPTLLALGWGVLATWWVGLFLGLPLACFAQRGPLPKKSVAELARPMLWLMGACGCLAILAGNVGYVAASNGWVKLIGPLAAKLPPERHVPFLIDLWMHNASYLGGFVGGLLLMAWVWRGRKLAGQQH